MMNKVSGLVLSAVAVVSGILSARAATVTVPDGGMQTLNSSWTDLTCAGSATLKIAPTGTTAGNTCWDCQTQIIATNGTVTLDFSDFNAQGKPVLFRRDFRADVKGNIVFKGPSTGSVKMLFGSVAAPDPHVNDPHGEAPKFGVPQAAVEGGFALVFTNMASLVTSLPTGMTGSWSVADGAQVLVWAPDALQPILGYTSGSTARLDRFDVFAMTNAAFAGAASVTVGEGRTFGIKPMYLRTGWSPSSNGATFSQDIVLEHATSRLLCRVAATLTLTGAVSGPGSVELMNNSYGSNVKFIGACTFEGPLSVWCVGSANNTSMIAEFASGMTQWTTPKDVSVGDVAYIVFYGGSVPLGRVTGTGFASSLRLGSSANVTIGTLGKGLGPLVVSGVNSGSTATATIQSAEDGAVLASVPTQTGISWDLSSVSLPYATVKATDTLTRTDLTPASVVTTDYLCRVFGTQAGTLPSGVVYSTTVFSSDVYQILSVSNATAVSVRQPDLDPAKPVSVNGGTAHVLSTFDWDDEAMLHLDASAAGSLGTLTNNEGQVRYLSDAITGQPDYPYVMTWRDVRPTQTSYSGYNARVYQNGTYDDSVKHVYMHAVTNGCNGLTYLSCVDKNKNSKRMPIVKTGAAADFKPVFCTMVFGSQGGGGKALLGNGYGIYARSDKAAKDVLATDPITTNASVKAWLNGTSVNPCTTGLSGGWDIVSMKLLPYTSVSALGWNKDTTDGGGQAYAEVLFFSRELTDRERCALEVYLARKWGLPYANVPSVEVTGSGTLAIEGNLQVVGTIHGTMRVENGSVTYAASTVPTAADIRNLSGIVGWFDPDDATHRVHTTLSYRPLEVNGVFDQLVHSHLMLRGNNLNGDNYVRAPHLNVSARGQGPERGWLDYSNCYASHTSGNYLKVSTSTRDDISDTTCRNATDSSLAVRTAFVISDSLRGGGTPVLDSVAGTAKIKDRTSGPIWAAKTDASVTGGTTYLNGRTVDGTTTSFTGGPELFSFTTTEQLDVTHEGGYSHTEGKTLGEMLGESIYFNRLLTDAERKDVETYLMWKWLGTLPPGRSNFTVATLSGNGSLSGVSQADLPTFAADYSGTVTLSDADLAFTVEAASSMVSGAIRTPQAKIVLPNAVTLTVTASGRLKAGAYTLVEAGTLVGATDLTVTYSGMDERMKARCTVVREGDKVVLKVAQVGITVIVR